LAAILRALSPNRSVRNVRFEETSGAFDMLNSMEKAHGKVCGIEHAQK
jgi:hypothetical protein